MLDVLHVIFEEDLIPQYEDHLEIKSKIRTAIYRDLYDETYKYPIESKQNQEPTPQEALGFDPDMELPDVSPDMPTKPFIEPTNPEDLPGLLKEPPLR